MGISTPQGIATAHTLPVSGGSKSAWISRDTVTRPHWEVPATEPGLGECCTSMGVGLMDWPVGFLSCRILVASSTYLFTLAFTSLVNTGST